MGNSVIQEYDIIIVGGGAGGLACANRIYRKNKKLKICLIEIEVYHKCVPQLFYSIFGTAEIDNYSMPIPKIIPKGIVWFNKTVTLIDPVNSIVKLDDLQEIKYKAIIIAIGARNRFDLIQGYEKEREIGRAISIYDYRTYSNLKSVIANKNIQNIIFTYPKGVVKCPGVTFKILFLWKEKSNSLFHFFTGRQSIFPIPYYANLIKRQFFVKEINSKFNNELISLSDSKATLGLYDIDQLVDKLTVEYDVIHITPSVSAPSIITNSTLVDSTGNWLDVDSKTLQHLKYKNVFGVGDVCSTRNTKTATAAFYQSKICVENVFSFLNAKKLESQYDGFSLCPLILQSGKGLMAQFNYEEFPIRKLPFIQPRTESRLNWLFIKYIYPRLYWSLGIKGRLPF